MLKYRNSLCTGCRICEVVCSLSQYKKINIQQSFIRYRDSWPEIGKVDFCRQCKAQKCVEWCPEEDALYINKYGLVELKQENCTGCLECSSNCPYGNLPLNEGFPLFCNTCLGEYQCAKWCPTGALMKGDEVDE